MFFLYFKDCVCCFVDWFPSCRVPPCWLWLLPFWCLASVLYRLYADAPSDYTLLLSLMIMLSFFITGVLKLDTPTTLMSTIQFLTTSAFNSKEPSVFKSNLNHRANKSTQIVNAGPRHLQILHTRLRLGCSSLVLFNYDLYRRNRVESHHCERGAVETPIYPLLIELSVVSEYSTNLPV